MDFLRPPFDWKYAVSYTNSRDGNARMFVMNEQWSLYWVSLDRCRVWAVWDRCWHYVRLLFEVWLWLLSDAHLSWVSNIVQQTCRWGNFKGVADPKMIYSPLCQSKSMSYYFPGNTHGEFGENLYSLWTFNRYKLTTAVKLQKWQKTSWTKNEIYTTHALYMIYQIWPVMTFDLPCNINGGGGAGLYAIRACYLHF